MKILLVSSSFFPKVDGSTRCIYDHARKLVERGHLVYLVTRAVSLKRGETFGAGRYEELEGIKILRTKISLRSSTNISSEKIRLAIEQIMMIIGLERRIRFDVVHVHGYSACYSALPAKFIFRLPLVITTHGTELLWPKWVRWKRPIEIKLGSLFEKIALNFCNIIIAQSRGVKNYMLKLYGVEIEKKIRIIPTGVDHIRFQPRPKHSNYSRILFVGALSEIKGVSSLIKAFSKVNARFPPSMLVLVGAGPALRKYQALANQLGVKGAVRFLGPIRDDALMIDQYSDSDIVVLPSNVGGPISCTILEGLSSGRPVISTNVPGGIPDIVNSEVGALVEREDVDGLASALTRLLSDDSYRERIGANARKAVEKCYTLDSMIDQLITLYQEVRR